MNVSQGNIFWNEKVGIIKNYPYMSKNRKCDVLVIGGGICGALTAYMQAKQGANVIVVDKNIIGYGATMETDGSLETRIDITNPKNIRNLNKKSIDKCNNLCKEALEDIVSIINELNSDEECKKYTDKLQFVNTDLVYYSDRVTNKISMYKLFEKLGKENNQIEYLEEDPIINLKTGIIIPESAAIINPYLLTQLIFIYLSKKPNVEIYENTGITNITSKEDRVECLTNNRFKVSSKNVILASGVHTLGYMKNTDLIINKTFTIVTEPIIGLNEEVTQIVAKDINFPNTSITFTKDKRIIFNGEDSKLGERMLNENYFKSFSEGKYKKLYIQLERLFNIPEETKITNCFYGIYLDTKDSLPIIDELDNLPNVYCNLGVGKNGIIFSMIGARMLKDISKRYHIKDMYLFRDNRW